MRVAIASRIFAPEPSAASFRLLALARAFARQKHQVTVLTTRPSLRDRSRQKSERGLRIRRFPVLRDKTGYVRGYLQYMSFDIPLMFRILFGRKQDLIVTEPPPTTGFFVRVAAAVRRTPYIYYAADIWSDAAESTGASATVVSLVRWMERFAMRGALLVYSVNAGVTDRILQIAPGAHVVTVGNGIDTEIFRPDGDAVQGSQYAIYSGTASEWQGASIFIEALERVRSDHPHARLVFLGQGSDWTALQETARRLPPDAVQFVSTVPPEEAAARMRGAVVSLASIRPDAGYSFAFPTKVFASWGAGTPVIFAGDGPVRRYMIDHGGETRLGRGCDYDVDQVACALREAFATPPSASERAETGDWARRTVSLTAVADRAVSYAIAALEAGS